MWTSREAVARRGFVAQAVTRRFTAPLRAFRSRVRRSLGTDHQHKEFPEDRLAREMRKMISSSIRAGAVTLAVGAVVAARLAPLGAQDRDSVYSALFHSLGLKRELLSLSRR